jgi:tight adherence protein C
MDPNLLTIALLGLLALGLITYGLLPRKSEQRTAVRRRLSGKHGADDEAELQARARASATESLVKKASPVLSHLIMPGSEQNQTHLRTKLANAGFRAPLAQTLFLASKSVLAVAGLIGGLVGGVVYHADLMVIGGLAAFCAGVGLMLPDGWLSFAASGRKTKIRYGLPDTLDLLVVSVEAGLALDAALKRVGEEMATVHPELSEELRIATMETQMGIPRNEALESFSRRTGIEEVRSLVSIVVQAEKFGTSIAKALRNQADALRTKRHQAAEERAQKTAVKLMIPLVLFIFPAMGVVLAGPAVINVIKAMKNTPALGG